MFGIRKLKNKVSQQDLQIKILQEQVEELRKTIKYNNINLPKK